MQEWLLDHICCPVSKSPLDLAIVREREGTHIIDGTLVSQADPEVTYEIRNGVPLLLRETNTIRASQTIEVFGSEWSRFEDWGWIDAPSPTSRDRLATKSGLSRDSQKDFLRKTALGEVNAASLELGSLALDAGCGNGRFSREASKYADRVISVDASEAANVAYRNMRKHGIENVGVVRASVLDLPFKDETFSYAFSIGVLQHTGNARGVFAEVSRMVPRGNNISINCYGTGTAIYEWVDRVLRQRTTRLSQSDKLKFSKRLADLHIRVLQLGGLGRSIDSVLQRVMCIRPTLVQMYDWYAPELAEHYTPEQLRGFLRDFELDLVAANFNFMGEGYDDAVRRKTAGAYNMLMRKRQAGQHN